VAVDGRDSSSHLALVLASSKMVKLLLLIEEQVVKKGFGYEDGRNIILESEEKCGVGRRKARRYRP